MTDHWAAIEQAIDLFDIFVTTADQEEIPTYDVLHEAAVNARAAVGEAKRQYDDLAKVGNAYLLLKQLEEAKRRESELQDELAQTQAAEDTVREWLNTAQNLLDGEAQGDDIHEQIRNLVKRTDGAEARVAELERALKCTFPLLQEAVDRPLWGSLQGSWQTRVREWRTTHAAVIEPLIPREALGARREATGE